MYVYVLNGHKRRPLSILCDNDELKIKLIWYIKFTLHFKYDKIKIKVNKWLFKFNFDEILNEVF